MSVETIFATAAQKPVPERAGYLDEACGGDAELRRKIERLLRAHDFAGEFLEAPAERYPVATGEFAPDPNGDNMTIPPRGATTAHVPTYEPGTVIADRYKLVERIGEGGMGEVWVAKQTEPVKRKVALKLIKAGMDSKAVLTRFEQERQALAMMDHPNIARVLDGGLTPTRQPFFVMELVNGLPLTKFCDQAKLTPRQRLELFVPICQAVQHAHQKGIVHRDLKPANILVTLVDDKPTPKVIDFGVAKATGGKLIDASMDTQFGAVVGTLEYMSPEQAGHSSDDVDTRADIYSLGVILYELLTGLRPFDSKRLKSAAIFEMIRVILEEEPSRPSTRLSTDEALPSLAAVRQTEPRKLTAMLRGELDWVVMKCLEKHRNRRYETANGLGRDIQRYLNDEPVEACPPSATYRLRKFAKKNRAALTTAATIAFLLVAGAGVSIWQAVRATHAETAERDRAEGERLAKLDAQEKAEAEKKARHEAERQQKFAEAISNFVQEDFLALTSVEGQVRFGGEGKESLSKDTTLQQLLDRAAQKLKARKDLDPQIEAELNWIIGVNLRATGEAQKAIEFLERSLQLLRDRLGRDHVDTIEVMNSLAAAYSNVGQYGRGLTILEEAYKLSNAKGGPEHAMTIWIMGNLAVAHKLAGRIDLAMPLYEDHFRLCNAKLGPEHEYTLVSIRNLAGAYAHVGKYELALPMLEKAFKICQAKLGPDHLDTIRTMDKLADAYRPVGKYDLAVEISEKSLKGYQSKLGPDHLETLACMRSLAAAYQGAGKMDLALPLAEKTVKLCQDKFGSDHPETLRSKSSLGIIYMRAGKANLAVPMLEETLRIQKASLAPDHHNILTTMHNLADAYRIIGKLELAVPMCEESLKQLRGKFGDDHPQVIAVMNNLAMTYEAIGKIDQALPLYEESFKLNKAKLGPDHPDTLTMMSNVALTYQSMGKLDLAIPLLEKSYKLHRGKFGLDHPGTLNAMNGLAEAYHASGKLDLALPLQEDVFNRTKITLGLENPATLSKMNNLAVTYWSLKQLDKSIPLFEESLKRFEKTFGRDHPETMHTAANLGVNYRDAGRLHEALPLLEEAFRASKKNANLKFVAAELFQAYRAAGKLDLALPILEEALEEWKAKLGPDHRETLAVMNNLAATYCSAKQFDKSIRLFEETLKICESKFGRDNLDTLRVIANLSVNYRDAGRIKEAIQLFEEVYEARKKYPEFLNRGLDLLDAYAKASENAKLAHLLPELVAEFRKSNPNDLSRVADGFAQMCQSLLEMKKCAEAEPLLRECLAIREKSLPDDWRTFNTMSMLGGSVFGQKKYADAEPLLLRGFEGMKQREEKIPKTGGAERRIPEAIDRLIEFYTATNKPDEVKKWQAERAKYSGVKKEPEKK